jgi:hypothetical protein
VPKEVLGEEELPGVLVVDRYSAYNKAPCKLQYCYEHLKRDILDLKDEFPESKEVEIFVDEFSYLIIQAIKLRNEPITDDEYYHRARHIKAIKSPANHLGIRRIQEYHRLYHWVDDRSVPADNNFAMNGHCQKSKFWLSVRKRCRDS